MKESTVIFFFRLCHAFPHLERHLINLKLEYVWKGEMSINIFILLSRKGKCYVFNILVFNFLQVEKLLFTKFYDYSFSLNIM